MKKLLLAIALVVLLAPPLIPTVSHIAQATLTAHNLSGLNPGNATGRLLSYAVFSITVSLIARLVRLYPNITARKDILWWFYAAVGVTAAFMVVNYLGAALFVDRQLGFLIAITTTGLIVVQITRIKFPEYPFDPYIRGPKLKTSKEVKALRGEAPAGTLVYGADYVEPADETLHMFIFGNIGAGKTTFIKCLMKSCAPREGELFIVFDPKIEFVPYLESIGKVPLILNPFDLRSVAWDLDKDIVNPALADSLSEILIPSSDSGSAGGNEENHWNQAARGLVAAIIKEFIRLGKPWDLRDLCLAIDSSDDIQELLKNSPSSRSEILKGLSGTMDSGANDYVLTTAIRLQKLHIIASRWHQAKQKISLKSLIEDESNSDYALVLGTDRASGSSVRNLNSLIFERLTQLILDLPDSKVRRIRLWIDEVTEASRHIGKNLVKFEIMVRSKGGSAVLGSQTYAGLVECYGEQMARQILANAIHKVIVGGVDGHTAKVLADDVVGKVEVIDSQIGFDEPEGKMDFGFSIPSKLGAAATPTSSNVHPNYRRAQRPLIAAEELFDTAIPSTGPDHGLTALFIGSRGGIHWHHYSWGEVIAMQGTPDGKTPEYDRIDERDPGYWLQPWTPEERKKWGLSPLSPADSNQAAANGSNSNGLPDWLPKLTREEIINTPEILESEFEAECARLGFAPEKTEFTIDELNMLNIHTN